MLKEHRDIIRTNLSTLVEKTDISRIIPILQKKSVLSQEAILRILNPAHDVKLQTANLYRTFMKRGPREFANLRDALQESNHVDLVELLNHTDSQGPNQVNRRPSLNSLVSRESLQSGDSDGESMNMYVPHPDNPTLKNASDQDSSGQELASDGRGNNYSVVEASASPGQSNARKCVEPCNLSEYYREIAPYTCRSRLFEGDFINIRFEEQLPVKVIAANAWKTGPLHYKMNSYPRGCALIVNNKEFQDSENFPKRNGAENDEKRLKEMLQQFYFDVEFHENKTRMEMNQILRRFSEKEELKNVDCIIVVFMSHGAEGASEEDTEIIGIDGIGYKTKEIVGRFSNDNCKALINKPKIFIFQACRGVLQDEGVYIEQSLYHRPTAHFTETDGRKIESSNYRIRIRTTSDVFIAYAVPPGRPANRDVFKGTWFIQTLVDVFSQNAWKYDLEDMLKMVDNKIKNVDNLEVRNFQAVATTTIGWNKKLYFNPGLKLTKSPGEASLDGTGIGGNFGDNCHGRLRQEWPDDENGAEDCPRRGCLSAQRCTVI